jgi:DNA-binding MarR family transcriptional regulator
MDQLPLEQAVVELSLAIGQLRRRLRAEVNPSELNLSQMAVLVRLHQQDDMTTAELARAESMTPQSMGKVMSSLELGGLVGRQPHPTDGRQMQFRVTAKGRAVRDAYKLAKRDWLMSAIGKLSPAEQSQLIIATHLIRRLGES